MNYISLYNMNKSFLTAKFDSGIVTSAIYLDYQDFLELGKHLSEDVDAII